MSFSADATRVRDASRSLAEREAALVRCVVRFSPFGVIGTFAHLDRAVGEGDRAERLLAAVGVLESAHTAWRLELGRFAEQRRAAKARGLRRVRPSELDRYASYGWPGEPAPERSAGRALDEGFLGHCGMTLWEPVPVNLRRRLKRAERAVESPARFAGCLLAAVTVTQAVLALLAWLIVDPPGLFWLGFAATAMVATAYAVAAGFRDAAKHNREHRATMEALDRRHQELSEQLRRAEQTAVRARTTM
ncbi:MAG TPA: hypothetical protein VK453_27555 [Micromonosporaceae bacterium]|nr:hypothetical protein [Micromonosporaceae bacterium]